VLKSKREKRDHLLSPEKLKLKLKNLFIMAENPKDIARAGTGTGVTSPISIFLDRNMTDQMTFLVVEETPLLNTVQSTILSLTALFTLIIGTCINTRIGRLLIKRRSNTGRSAIDKLLLTYTIISITSYTPLLVIIIVIPLLW
jgi:hypothetical protein